MKNRVSACSGRGISIRFVDALGRLAQFTWEQLLISGPNLVLLVDDDDHVRETSANMLEELGYGVVQAASGFEALAKLETFPTLEVMVTDVRMPGMSGLELLRIANARYRQLRVILISGYFTPQPINCRFLQKPFRTRELDAAIQAELRNMASS